MFTREAIIMHQAMPELCILYFDNALIAIATLDIWGDLLVLKQDDSIVQNTLSAARVHLVVLRANQ